MSERLQYDEEKDDQQDDDRQLVVETEPDVGLGAEAVLELFEQLLGETTNYATMKKHFKAYIHGWDHAKELRVLLMETEDAGAAVAILQKTL